MHSTHVLCTEFDSSCIGDDKWKNVVTCNAYEGQISGEEEEMKKEGELSGWSKKNDYLNLCVMPKFIKFETVTESHKIKKEEEEEEEETYQLRRHSQYEAFTRLPNVRSDLFGYDASIRL